MTNEVLRRAKAKRSLWNTLNRRKIIMIKHTLRHKSMLHHLLKEGIGKKCERPRLPLKYLSQLMKTLEIGS